MRKTLSFLVITILLFSGFGAIAFQIDNTNYKIKKIELSQPIIKVENQFLTISMKESNKFLMKQNKPILPSYIETFTFPFGTEVKNIICTPLSINQLSVLNYVKQTPKPISAGLNIKNKININSDINYCNDPYPNKWFSYNIGSGIKNLERCIFVNVEVFPVRYIPAESKIVWTDEIKIEIEYVEPRESIKLNDNYSFIIIGPSEFSNELEPLVNHKISKGIPTIFISLDDIYNSIYFPVEGRDNPEKIKYFIKNSIENWGNDYILLVGGNSKCPARETHICFEDNMDNEIFLSDLYYADIYDSNGDFCSWDSNENNIFGEYNWSGTYFDEVDLYPDVYLGRLACVSENEVTTSVNKIINYENNQAYTQSWYKNLVVIGGDHAPGDDEKISEGEFVNQAIIDIMNKFTEDKIWDSNGRLSGTFPTGVTEINNALNNGCGFVDFSGHGNTNVWATHPHEKHTWIPTPTQGYFSGFVQALNNLDSLPIVIIGACSTCKYNVDPSCFGWSFILNNHGGGIAACGASGLDWFYEGSYVIEKGFEKICVDAFRSYDDGALTFGEMWSGAIHKYIYPEMDDLDHKTVEEWQAFGDPSLKIRPDPQAPEKPDKPTGPNKGKIGESYNFSTKTNDPTEDDIWYCWDWDDGSISDWIGPFESGEYITTSHSWSSKGEYIIKVKAKDKYNYESEWSDSLVINMPKSKISTISLLEIFIKRYQYLFFELEELFK